MSETSPRFSSIFLLPLATSSRRASRNALDPSPSVIRPETSITVTSPTWRLFNLTLTYAYLPQIDLRFFRPDILDQSNFRARRRHLAHFHVVHERAHQEQAPTR